MRTSRNLWPAAIVAAFAVFITGLALFVVFATANKMELVRADYYAAEVCFQQHLERVQRTLPLRAQIAITYDAGRQAIAIALPRGHTPDRISGHIELYRPSDAARDRTIPLATNAGGMQQIDARTLQPGLWRVRVFWTLAGAGYYFDQSVVIRSGSTVRAAESGSARVLARHQPPL